MLYPYACFESAQGEESIVALSHARLLVQFVARSFGALLILQTGSAYNGFAPQEDNIKNKSFPFVFPATLYCNTLHAIVKGEEGNMDNNPSLLSFRARNALSIRVLCVSTGRGIYRRTGLASSLISLAARTFSALRNLAEENDDPAIDPEFNPTSALFFSAAVQCPVRGRESVYTGSSPLRCRRRRGCACERRLRRFDQRGCSL